MSLRNRFSCSCIPQNRGSSDLVDVIGSLDDQLRVNIKMVVNVSISG